MLSTDAQAYPTTARTFALGCNNAMSRVGALLAPFLAVDLASRSAAAAHGAEGIIAGACFVAAAATAALPYETRGRQLTARQSGVQGFIYTVLGLKVWENNKSFPCWTPYAFGAGSRKLLSFA